MSTQSSGSRHKLSEKGLLTPDNCVVALIDHQPQMLFGVSNFDRQTIINNTVALAKATQVFDVPGARRSSGLVSGPRPASPCPPFRRYTMATKYMSLKMPAETLASSITTTR